MNALVIVPTFNEAATIGGVVADVLAVEPRAEVLVVDDGSPDGTAELVADLIARGTRRGAGTADLLARAGQPRLHLLRRDAKAGLGAAYRAGFAWGLTRGFDALVEMDADRSHPPDRLPVLLDALDDADLAIGSRYVPGGGTRNWSRLREAVSRGGNAYVRLALGMPVRDATAGYRAYRRQVLQALALDRIQSGGYCFQIEMAHRTWQAGFRVVEIPIVFTERAAGVSKMNRRIVAEALWRVTLWGLTGGRRRARAPHRDSVSA